MKDTLMKKILLLHMLVFVSATLPISSVASDEVETLKCTIIADAITGNTLYETGECARRVSPCSSLNFHWQSWGLIVESCSRQNHLRGN